MAVEAKRIRTSAKARFTRKRNEFLKSIKDNKGIDTVKRTFAELNEAWNTVEGKHDIFTIHLRASFCKYRKSGDSFKIFNFLIFCPNKAFSELFSKIQLKGTKALEFFQNRGKFENRHFGLPRQLKIDKNDAFSFRSCW